MRGVLLALLATTGAPAAIEPPEQISAYIREEMALNDIPGLSLAVVKGSHAVALAAFGVRNLATGEPMSVDTPVELASVSKAFTGLAVAELVRSGSLRLEEPVVRYLPEFAAGDASRSNRIEVRHLLRHTSGLSRHDDFLVPCCGRPGENDLRLAVERLRRARLRHRPGSAFSYANSNYVLLAAIIERVSGEPFADFMRRRVFAPLGMHRTTLEEGQARAWGKAAGHERRWGRMVPETAAFTGWPGASQVKSTARDLALFLAAMLGPRGELWRKTLQEATATAQSHFLYDWGWFVRPSEDWLTASPVIEHGGDLWSGNTAVLLAPRQGLGVAVLINAGVRRAQPISRGVLLRALGRPGPRPARQAWTRQTDNWAIAFTLSGLCLLIAAALRIGRLLREWRCGLRRLGLSDNRWERARVILMLAMSAYLMGLLLTEAMPPAAALPTSLRSALPLLAVSTALLLASAALAGLSVPTRGRSESAPRIQPSEAGTPSR